MHKSYCLVLIKAAYSLWEWNLFNPKIYGTHFFMLIIMKRVSIYTIWIEYSLANTNPLLLNSTALFIKFVGKCLSLCDYGWYFKKLGKKKLKENANKVNHL